MSRNAADILLARGHRTPHIGACCEYPQLAYSPPSNYLSDEEFYALQRALMAQPEASDVIPGAGGLRKLRFADRRRGKGTRGGLRVIYFHWSAGRQFWLFALYDKNEVTDLTAGHRRILKQAIEAELAARRLNG